VNTSPTRTEVPQRRTQGSATRGFGTCTGEPDIGDYVHWNRVTSKLKDLNRFHKVVVHTIAYSERKWYRDQLEKIADATLGEFRWFE
jgi:hypothetical protein